MTARAVVLAVALWTAGPTAAQEQESQVDTPGSSADALNIPTDVTVLGHADPSIRKATAIVNGTIITDTDVDQRLALVLAANAGKIPDSERARLRLQVLSNLIDEALQIQEAAANKITVEKTDIDQTFGRVAGQFKQTPASFATYIREKGSSEASMKRQIEGELAWRRLLSRQVEPFVNVSDDEVNQVISRLKASKGAAEYHVGEIYLSATPVNGAQVLGNANRIVGQIRQGASFVAYAHEYSEASTRAVGGDLGWVRAEQLPESLASVVQGMPQGSISDPIPVDGGYSVVALIDKRQVLTADPRDAVLALKQISINFPVNASKETVQPKLDRFTKALHEMQGCGQVAAAAAAVGGEVVDNDQVRVRDLPPALQPIMLNLRVGEATPPFGSSSEGTLRALVICGREEPEVANDPNFEQIQNQLEEQRVNLRAQRYLRDLRRDAVIDYR